MWLSMFSSLSFTYGSVIGKSYECIVWILGWWFIEGDYWRKHSCRVLSGGRGYLYIRLDIILVKGLSKHTLNTYFTGIKIDPKYAFVHAFFLICASCPFQNFINMTKNIPFFPILHIFAPLNDVRAYIALF